MGCFPFFFSRQARFEREFDCQVQALHAVHEAQLAGMTEAQRLFADLQRSRAVQAPSAAPLLPMPRAPSMDSLKFDQDLLAWQNSGPLGQREHRERAARLVRTTKRKRNTSLTLQHLELDDLPECLVAMGNLTELYLCQCRIGEIQGLPPRLELLEAIGVGLRRLPALPASLQELTVHHNLLATLPDLPTHLQVLDVNHNRLCVLPSMPTGLRTLTVCDNRLTELPILPPGLRRLYASNNQLVVLPEIPATTGNVEVHHNCLTDLPRSITAMDILEWVAVYDNPLPACVLERVGVEIAQRTDNAIMFLDIETPQSDYRRRYGVLEASTPPLVLRQPPPLVTAALAWYARLPYQASELSERRENWEIAYCRGLGDVGDHPSASFAKFLDRLSETADYRDPRSRPALTQKVCRLLDRLPDNDALREHCYALATDALGECQDRIAAGLDHMELHALSADTTEGALNPSQIQSLGMGMLKLKELQIICAELSVQHPTIDEIELYLALRTRFASALELPIVAVQMHYSPPPEITAEQWGAARERLEAVATNSERQIAFLAQWQPWQASLERQALPLMIIACKEKARREQSLQVKLDVLMDQLSGLPAGTHELSDAYFDLQTEIGQINFAYHCLEQKLIDPVRLELTRQILER